MKQGMVWLAVASAAVGGPLDRDVRELLLRSLHTVAPDVRQVRILAEQSILGQRLVVVAGSPGRLEIRDGRFVWDATSVIGVFAKKQSTVSALAIERGVADCQARVERIAATEVVVSCAPEKGDRLDPTHRFELDGKRGRLARHATFRPVAFARAWPDGGNAVLVGDDGEKAWAVSFHAAAYSREVGGVSGLSVLPDVPPSIQKEPFRPVRFGPGNGFRLVQAQGLVVEEGSGPAMRQYRLPQTTVNEFARVRPSVRSGSVSGNLPQIAEEIGPWQVVDGTFWFAKRFYDGEGLSGVGGYGSFDVANRRFQVRTSPAMAGYSATAMTLTEKRLWIALAAHGEYGSTPGGLLCVDRATSRETHLPFSDLVSSLVIVGSVVVMTTNAGIAVIDRDRVRRFFVDRPATGPSVIREALP